MGEKHGMHISCHGLCPFVVDPDCRVHFSHIIKLNIVFAIFIFFHKLKAEREWLFFFIFTLCWIGGWYVIDFTFEIFVQEHRVDRVLGFFSQSSELGPSLPSPFGSGHEGRDSLAGESGGSQFGRGDRHCVTLGTVYVYFVLRKMLARQIHPKTISLVSPVKAGRGSQGDVVYLGWPIAPCWGGGVGGFQPMGAAVHMEPK